MHNVYRVFSSQAQAAVRAPSQGAEQPLATIPRRRCPWCESEGLPLHGDLRDLLYGVGGVWTIRRCSRPVCGFHWLDPLPSERDVALLYKRYYTHTEGAETDNPLRRTLYRLYRWAHRLVFFPLGLHRQFTMLEWMGLGGSRPGRLLDVGCGNGDFLERMRIRGWDVAGCEVDPRAAQIALARGLRVCVGEFTRLPWQHSSFDAVTLHHVLEHFPDPRPVFALAFKVLSPGGKLVVVTPNVKSLGHRLFGRAWRGLEPPRHFCLYHPDLLKSIAQAHEFQVLHCVSTAARADIILGASMTIAEAGGNAVPEFPPPAPRKILKALLLQGKEHGQVRRGEPVGEECFLVCKKPEHTE